MWLPAPGILNPFQPAYGADHCTIYLFRTFFFFFFLPYGTGPRWRRAAYQHLCHACIFASAVFQHTYCGRYYLRYTRVLPCCTTTATPALRACLPASFPHIPLPCHAYRPFIRVLTIDSTSTKPRTFSHTRTSLPYVLSVPDVCQPSSCRLDRLERWRALYPSLHRRSAAPALLPTVRPVRRVISLRAGRKPAHRTGGASLRAPAPSGRQNTVTCLVYAGQPW